MTWPKSSEPRPVSRCSAAFAVHAAIAAWLSSGRSPAASPIAKIIVMIAVLVLTSGCDMIQTVPSASGRVIDAVSGEPVSHAEVVRECSGKSKRTSTNENGDFSFHGRWRLQVALGDTTRSARSYRIEAAGYQRFETNRFTFGWANRGSAKDNLGVVAITPITPK